jgi:hypothetical protein
VILYVYLYDYMPKPLFQTLSTTSGVFCDLHMAPVPAAILFGQIVRSSQLAGDQRPARSGGTPNPNPNHQLAQHTNTSFLAFGFWPTRQRQPASPAPGWWSATGGKALGELEANPQLNCYRWY